MTTFDRAQVIVPNKRALRIVHVLTSLEGGGMERIAIQLAAGQRRLGHDAQVLALKGGPLSELATQLDVPVTIIPPGSKISRVWNALGYYHKFKPDIVNAHNPTSLHYAVLAKRASRARVVMTDHGQTRGTIRVATAHEKRATDIVVSVSAETERQRTDWPRDHRHDVIHNGIELPEPVAGRAEARAELGLGNAVVGIMAAGMVPVKGHAYLLQAIAHLNSRAPGHGVKILLAGDGPERENLERMVVYNGIDFVVRFMGFCTNMRTLYTAADFFVLPSLNEGLPISILEAMAYGLPVIATKVGGVPELVVEGTTGLLVLPLDSVALAQAIAWISSDHDLRLGMGTAGRKRVEENFTISHMVDRYVEVYNRLLSD